MGKDLRTVGIYFLTQVMHISGIWPPCRAILRMKVSGLWRIVPKRWACVMDKKKIERISGMQNTRNSAYEGHEEPEGMTG